MIIRCLSILTVSSVYVFEASRIQATQASFILDGLEANLSAPSQVLQTVQEKFFKDEVQGNWFTAKENYVFRGLRNSTNQSTADEMVALVELRSEFLCRVLFQQARKNCLFDAGNKPLAVSIPHEIHIRGQTITFSRTQQQCVAMAIGSVTLLSDLDFTVSCTKAAHLPEAVAYTKENLAKVAKRAALDEVYIAQKLTFLVYDLLKVSPGTVFDTNFYTNTFAYGKSLGMGASCSQRPARGLVMALFAAAQGFAAAADYGESVGCPAQTDINANVFGEGKTAEVLATIAQELHAQLALEKKISKKKQKIMEETIGYAQEFHSYFIDRILSQKRHSRLMHEAQNRSRRNSDTMIKESADRMYYSSLEIGIEDMSNFCIYTAAGLIFANEAYWVEGAIADVVFKRSVNIIERIESVLMNLGYAMSHVVEEFERADGSDDDSIKACAYGDGLIKFGKYMQRVEATRNTILKVKPEKPVSVKAHEPSVDFKISLTVDKSKLKNQIFKTIKAMEEAQVEGQSKKIIWANRKGGAFVRQVHAHFAGYTKKDVKERRDEDKRTQKIFTVSRQMMEFKARAKKQTANTALAEEYVKAKDLYASDKNERCAFVQTLALACKRILTTTLAAYK